MRYPLLLLACALFLFGCATYNPATGRQEFIMLTTPMEVMMGQEVNAQIEASSLGGALSGEKMMQVRLSRIGQRLAQISDRQDYQYHFYLVNKNEMNAFTVPGGYVYFYTGLYSKLGSDDEIAAVLAHEIGHCAARHVVKKYQAALGYDLLSTFVMNSLQSDIAVRVARLGGDALMQLGMSAYSRKDEYEADRLAVKYMYLAGYDPNAIIATFEVLARDSKGDDRDWLLLRSHPYLKDRIEAVKKEIELVKSKY